MSSVRYCLPCILLRSTDLRKRASQRRITEKRETKTYNSNSNLRKRRSRSHCCAAFSLDSGRAAHGLEGLSLPRESFAQGVTTEVKLSGARHRLSPGRKLC